MMAEALGQKNSLFAADDDDLGLADLVGPSARQPAPAPEAVRVLAERNGFPSRDPVAKTSAPAAPAAPAVPAAKPIQPQPQPRRRWARLAVRFDQADRDALAAMRMDALGRGIDADLKDVVVAAVRYFEQAPLAQRLEILRAVAGEKG